MKQPVEYYDNISGIKVVIFEREQGTVGIKTYYNNLKIDISMYDLSIVFLSGLQKAIGEFLGQE